MWPGSNLECSCGFSQSGFLRSSKFSMKTTDFILCSSDIYNLYPKIGWIYFLLLNNGREMLFTFRQLHLSDLYPHLEVFVIAHNGREILLFVSHICQFFIQLWRVCCRTPAVKQYRLLFVGYITFFRSYSNFGAVCCRTTNGKAI